MSNNWAVPRGSNEERVACPECGGEVTIEPETMFGQIVTCPDCGEEWEVVCRIALAKVETEEEDWGE